jgi:endonuclease/exonuclease/phosphatase family metal-dependent hydrolase
MPSFRGFPACDCLVEWLPWVEKLLLHRKIIARNIDIYQLIGGASASAGTHRTGGAFDVAQATWGALQVYRAAGADASWRRTPAQGFTLHAHGVLRGCPHNTAARYQITAVDNNRNGLANNGRDDGPRPLSKRTWKQGIEWIKTELGITAPVPTPVTETVFDHGHMNVASRKPGWFPVPWEDRQAAIGAALKNADCSIITVNETHYKQQTADILAGLGPSWVHQSSPIGNDIFYKASAWQFNHGYQYKEYSLGAQDRFAGVLHLIRVSTGQRLAVVNTHLPYGSASLRTTAARNLAELLADVDDPIVLSGDFKNEAFAAGTPHQVMRKAGYEWMREQAPITNGSSAEFPKKGQWLCDIATDRDRKNGAARITGGALMLTGPKLSDHRLLKVRVHVR